MNMNDRKAIAKPMIYVAIIMVLSSCLLFGCNNNDKSDNSNSETTSQTEYISQDKESVGY